MMNEPDNQQEQVIISQPMRRVALPLSNGWAWAIILGLCIGIFAYAVFISRSLLDLPSDLLRLMGAKDNRLIFEQGQYWRLLTATFLHGGLLHMLFNGYALYTIGRDTERLFGTPRFLALYFIAGLAGSVASYAFSPYVSVGASGAIFGTIGAMTAYYRLARSVMGEAANTPLQSLISLIVINLFIGFTNPIIDNYGHIGGLLAGLLVGWLLAPRLSIQEAFGLPVIEARYLPYGWAATAGVAVVLVALVLIIRPPLL